MSYLKALIESTDPAFLPDLRIPQSLSDLSVNADWEQFFEAVLNEEERLIKQDGIWHVGHFYFADASDAAKQRRWQAETNCRESARRRVAERRGK